MSKEIILRKATRIEGNANIKIEIENGRVKTARFMVHDFRGFERFMQGRRVEFVPHLVSRICGLCSASHQIASLKAIEDAFGIEVPFSVSALREIILLSELISSHAFSYFFLSMPDFVNAQGGLFELIKSHPEITQEALALRNAGKEIVKILGKRAIHPVSLGIGRFLSEPTASELEDVFRIATEIKDRTTGLMNEVGTFHAQDSIAFVRDHTVHFLAYDSRPDRDTFHVYNSRGENIRQFKRQDFEENISEMRAEWSFAKFPYLNDLGFPGGIMLVGPLSRSFLEDGFLSDPDITAFPLAQQVRDRDSLMLESYDISRLFEILWSSKRILGFLERIDCMDLGGEVDLNQSGQGIGVVEAPRGVLVHKYLINHGRIEEMRLLVATQFNNAYINMLLKDLAEKYVGNNKLLPGGERVIGRCVRIFDPCLSCATH